MKVEIGDLSTLPRDRGIRVTVGDERIAMFRIGNDVYAIGDVCSHAEASLAEGEVFGTEVECPRHGSEFDLTTGEPRSLPATVAVPTYEVMIEDNVVFLNMGDS
ncbi:MAG TPA: non-heme iron oxygenase ferredoxin subunit [Acidimicrobiia bacterium]